MSSILRKYCSELSKVIAHPNVVATALYSKELITRASLEEASIEAKTPTSRAIKLLTDVTKILKSQPEKFPIFLDVLRDELEHVSPLIDKIQEDYDASLNGNSEKDKLSDQTTSSVRQRQTQQIPAEEEDEQEEEEEQVSTSTIVCVVLKGIGSVMLLSLIMWLGFLFIYKPPANAPNEDISGVSQEDYVPSTLPVSSAVSCHPVEPRLVYEELQAEISDSKTLGIHLGIPKVKRDIIERENHSERERLIEILHACHDLDKCQCWEDIESALTKYGNTRKARQIRERYIK